MLSSQRVLHQPVARALACSDSFSRRPLLQSQSAPLHDLNTQSTRHLPCERTPLPNRSEPSEILRRDRHPFLSAELQTNLAVIPLAPTPGNDPDRMRTPGSA